MASLIRRCLQQAERRKVSSGLTSLSVFALVILISYLRGHLLFLQGEKNIALLPLCFYGKPRTCCPPQLSALFVSLNGRTM